MMENSSQTSNYGGMQLNWHARMKEEEKQNVILQTLKEIVRIKTMSIVAPSNAP